MITEAEKPVLYRRPIEAPRANIYLLPPGVDSLKEYVYEKAIPRGGLRRGQVEALRETVKFLEDGGRVGYVEQVSGYGKSRWMQEVSEGFGGRQVFIVPSETASENMVSKLNSMEVGRVDKDHKQFGFAKTVITMQSLNRIWRGIERGDRKALDQGSLLFGADIVFADEVHHYLTPQSLKILSTFLQMNTGSVMLGATATEGFSIAKNAEKLFGKCLHRVDLQEGVEEGVLISPHVQLVKTGVSLDGLKLTPEGDFVFNASVPLVDRDRKLLEAYLRASGKEGKLLRTIAFLSNIGHAMSFRDLAVSMGIPADVITGNTKNREQIYQRLEQGRIKIVATVATAIESLDKPWLEGTLHSAQTRSMRVARQAFPRSMRNYDGKKPPWIIQVVDEATSANRRPIIVPDILGVQRFLNGSVVSPQATESRQSGKDREGSSDSRGEIVLSGGTEVNVEIIDINSLFRMGIIDRAKLFRQGLLRDEDIDSFRTQLLDALQHEGDFGTVNYHAVALRSTAGVEVSLRSVIAAMYGISSGDVRRKHIDRFRFFLLSSSSRNGRDGDQMDHPQRAVLEGYLREEEFKDLCRRYRDGELSDEELVNFGGTINEIISLVPYSGAMGLRVFGAQKIDHPKFKGTVVELSRLLGLNKKGQFTKASRAVLFDLLNKHGAIFTYSTRDRIEHPSIMSEEWVGRDFREACEALRKGELPVDRIEDLSYTVYEMLEGIGLRSSWSRVRLANAHIDHPQYKGTVSSLSKLLGFFDKKDGLNFTSDSRSQLLRFAYDPNGDYEEVESSGNKLPTEEMITTPQQRDHSGEPMLTDKQKIYERLPGIGETRPFLREVLDDAIRRGLDIRTVTGVNGHHVYKPQFEGTLTSLIGKLVGKPSGKVRSSDIQRILEYAGFF